MSSNIKITITPLSEVLLAAVAVIWILAGASPSHAALRLLSETTPFLLLVATWIVLLAAKRRLIR